MGAVVPWHDTWDLFPAYLDNISVTNTTYREATSSTGGPWVRNAQRREHCGIPE